MQFVPKAVYELVILDLPAGTTDAVARVRYAACAAGECADGPSTGLWEAHEQMVRHHAGDGLLGEPDVGTDHVRLMLPWSEDALAMLALVDTVAADKGLALWDPQVDAVHAGCCLDSPAIEHFPLISADPPEGAIHLWAGLAPVDLPSRGALSATDPLTGAEAAAMLAMMPARIEPGLTDAELDAVEGRFGFRLQPEHRMLLSVGLPVGSRRLPDWRHGREADLLDKLNWPIEGTLFDVERNGLWCAEWGPRPQEVDEALAVARENLAHVPRMVPIYAHRYLPSADAAETGHPVLSMMQTDIICYGTDLVDYFRHEFSNVQPWRACEPTVAFWSRFVNE